MSDILLQLLGYFGTFIGGGGLVGIFYFKLNKRLKAAVVKSAEVDVKTKEIANLSASNEEWQKLYHNCFEEQIKLKETLASIGDKLGEAYEMKDAAMDRYGDCRTECNKKDMVIAELNWYKCEVNGCPYRRPPRKYGEMDFPKDAVNPLEHPNPDYI